MRNDRSLETLRNLDKMYNEHVEIMYDMLKMLFRKDNDIRKFAIAYYLDEMTIPQTSKNLNITIEECKRRRRVIKDSIEVMSEVFLLEYIEDEVFTKQNILLTGNEDTDITIEIATLKEELKYLDTRERETRDRKPKPKCVSANNMALFSEV